MKRDKLINFINEYLKIDDFKDYCINGLQVEGKEEVKKIITGVSLNLELIEQAIAKKADMIMVHHGIFESGLFQLKGAQKERLKKIIVNDLNLAGYHLPLDAHPVVGNNILLLQKLGIKKGEKFDIGWMGKFETPVKLEEIVEKLDKLLKTKSYVIKSGVDKIRSVGIISGGASPDVTLAIEKNLDLFIAGDIRENVVDIIKEGKINFINGGHYRTEKFGIQALGELVAKKFGLEVEFVEIDNEI
jgi:dinuclear metal center YbgI/SA1388 family protein